MLRKHLLVITIAALIFSMLGPVNAFASRSVDVSLETDDVVVSDGQSVTLEIKFTNNTGSKLAIQSYSVNGGSPVFITTDNIVNSPGSYSLSLDYIVAFGPNTQAEVYVDVTYIGMTMISEKTESSNTIVFENASSLNAALEFSAVPDTTTVQSGGEVNYSISVKNNGNVGYENFNVVLNGDVIKTYSLLAMGAEKTFTSTQGYFADRVDTFGYSYDYTYRGVSGHVDEINAARYSITVLGEAPATGSTDSPTSSNTSSPTPTPEQTTSDEDSSQTQDEQYIYRDKNAMLELIVQKPGTVVKVNQSVETVIIIKNTGDIMIKDIQLSGGGLSSNHIWDKIAPNKQKRYADTLVALPNSVYKYRVTATDIRGNIIEIESQPIILNMVSNQGNNDADNNILSDSRNMYVYLMVIAVALVVVLFLVIYFVRKNSVKKQK